MPKILVSLIANSRAVSVNTRAGDRDFARRGDYTRWGIGERFYGNQWRGAVRTLQHRIGCELGHETAPTYEHYQTAEASARFEHLAPDQGCAFCQSTKSEIHHYLPRATTPDRAMDGGNMVRVCSDVHRAVHNDPAARQAYQECLVRAQDNPTLPASLFFDPLLEKLHAGLDQEG